ncbi:MAG: type III-B CRISPR module RAMP protein Cmr6 [Candidatus Brocadia sp.]|jgi:CRISPR-associated protein Cmr6
MRSGKRTRADKKIVVDDKILPQKTMSAPRSPQKRNAARNRNIQQKLQTSAQQNKWSIENTKLPRDTRNTISSINIDNYSLKLNKASQFIDDKFIFFKTDRGNIELNVLPDYSNIPLKDISERQKINLELSGFACKKIENTKVDWRLVIGVGGSSVYETSMTLHHIYGIPYIPGSAIKGVLRHFIVSELLANDFPDDNLNIINKLIEIDDIEVLIKKGIETMGNIVITYTDEDGQSKKIKPSQKLLDRVMTGWDDLKKARKIFGNQGRQGNVIFVDSFPITPPKIKPDVMNPHYSDYYSGKTDKNGNPVSPADYLSPVPIYFLTVEDTAFDFYLAAKKKDKDIFDEKIGNFNIVNWLKKALCEHGIGAKTAVGYGYLNV